MGACKLYKCRCGYEKKLMVGVGRGSQNLAIISRSVPEEVFADFSREDFNGRVLDFGMVNLIISCPSCRSLNTVTQFSYTLPDNEVKYIPVCPDCGESCQPLEDQEIISCPKCNRKMNCSIAGHWD